MSFPGLFDVVEEWKIQPKIVPTDKSLSDEAIDWLVRLNSGRPSPMDQLAFRRWRSRSSAHEAAAAEAEAILGGVDRTRQADRMRRGGEPIPFRPASRRIGRRLALTGAIAASAAAIVVALPALEPLSSIYADHATSVGERRRVVLPDGSIATLNTATALSVHYSDSQRRIVLHDGEALFDVRRDPGRPFVVAAGPLQVRAIGTAFIVNLEAPGECVIVTEGTVEVMAERAAPIRLDAGQRLDIGQGDTREIRDIDIDAAVAWRRGKLIFNNKPLQSVVAELQRYRPGRMIIANGQLKNLHVTGVFDLDDPDRLLRAVGEATGAQVILLPLLTVIY